MRTLSLSVLAVSASCLIVAPALASPPQFVLQWGSLGGDFGAFQWPIGIAPAPDGSLYVADSHNRRVQRFSPSGEFLASWGRQGQGDGEFVHPDDVAVDARGAVYVVDAVQHRVQKFTAEGQFLLGWTIEGFAPSDPGTFRIAAAINALFVVDTWHQRVLKFDQRGTLLATWGGEGSEAGRFRRPLGIAVAGVEVLVVDSDNRRIQRFTADGAFLGMLAPQVEGEWRPVGIAVDDRGRVLVTDATDERVYAFSETGAVLARWGGSGTSPGQFLNPYGVTAAPGGAVYVTDHDNHRVQMFRFEPLGVQEAAWAQVKSLFR